jgi:hypothetical protein
MAERNEARKAAVAPDGRELDRRDSDRVTIHLLVRDAAVGGSFEPHRGNLGLGGVYFVSLQEQLCDLVYLFFILYGV